MLLRVELHGCCFILAGVDLISGVSCKTPHEWVDNTKEEWEFSSKGPGETFHVSIYSELLVLNPFCSLLGN